MFRKTLPFVLSTLSLLAPQPSEAAPKSSAAKTKAAEQKQSVYIVGGDIYVGNGQIIKDGVIHIEGDTIKAVGGPELKSKVPAASTANTTAIQATGKLIAPGFIASHTLLGLVEIGLEASTREDNVAIEHSDHWGPIRASFDPSMAINADSSLLAVQAVEGITSSTVAPRAGLIAGQVSWIDLWPGDHKNLVQARNIAVHASLGQIIGGSRAATLAELERAFEDALFYKKKKSAFERNQSRQLIADSRDLEALLPVLEGKVPLTISAHRASDLLAIAALTKKFKLRTVIIGGTEAWKVASELADAKVFVAVEPSQNLPVQFENLGARFDNAAILDKAGVQVIIADGGDPHHGRELGQEAGIAVSHGLPWEKALQAITLNPAKAYGMDKQYGSVEAGKVANLVIWSGDCFELSSKPEHVFVRGKELPLESRQTKLRDRYLDLSKFGK